MTNKGQQITAIALNPTRKLLAFTERGERPLLVVYDLERRKRVKLLRCAEFRTLEVGWWRMNSMIIMQVVSLAFSHDSKYLLAQGGHPDHQLVYFFWEKGKVSIDHLIPPGPR